MRGDYDSGLAEVTALNPVRYTFKGNDEAHKIAADSGKEFIGLVAQDAEQFMPEMVTQAEGEIDGAKVHDLRMLDPSALTFALVNCIKELKARIGGAGGALMRLVPIPLTEHELWEEHWAPFLPRIAQRSHESVADLRRQIERREVRLVLVVTTPQRCRRWSVSASAKWTARTTAT